MGVASALMVSVSGIRGIVGKGLTAEAATRFAAAYGSTLTGQRVVLARDSRPSGEMLRHAVLAGLLSTGCHVDDIGIAPTPTCGFAIRHWGAAGGIQITASHNPAPWNGLKMFGPDGAVLSAANGAAIRDRYETGSFPQAPWDAIGTRGVPPPIGTEHLAAIHTTMSVAEVAQQRFRVLLDANAGAGGPLGVQLLTELGCDVVAMGCEPTGQFTHEPEPIPAHLHDVAPWVPRHGCAVGFVLDPDADRLALIDENGQCISEEYTLALAVRFRLQQQRGPVVINMSTSRMSEDIAREYGVPCYRAAVGEANVVSRMRSTGAVLGGEGNGGVIDPRIGWVRDPFVAMAFLLSLMAREQKSLSQLVAELPRYAMLKTKFTLARERLNSVFTALEARWPTARRNHDDGLRLEDNDWWLHIRSSNTEPIVRVIAEATTSALAEELCRQAGAVIMATR
ncbi:MAG: phosphoglucosamine mutase [Gemmataceae bacterium]|nr:phosphoglucosamine mutase [Gemmata sp.]MDW8197681.1 phosphoglucosamine mutase [Gemmataceae bacterium]